MIQSRVLGLVLLWALCYSGFSKAEDVIVPIVNGIYVTVTTNTSAPLQEIKNNPAAVQVQLGDDGNVAVPLQFVYNYFGQSYTQSWMHSNGVISFQSPSMTGNFCCSGQSLVTTQNNQFDYSIMALWTDLYARNGGSTFYLSTPTSMTYGWYGTSDYGNINKRSSFEIMIDDTGGLDMRWSGIDSAQYVTLGFTGDLNAGQYYQYYNGQGSSLSSLSSLQIRLGNFGVVPEVDPCTAIPVTDPTCINAYQPIESSPAQDASETDEPNNLANPENNLLADPIMVANDPISPSGPSVSSEINNSSIVSNNNPTPQASPIASGPSSSQQSNQQTTNSSTPQQQSTTKSTTSISASQIMSMNNNEQSKLTNTEKTSVQLSAEVSAKIDAETAKDSEKTAEVISESSSSVNTTSSTTSITASNQSIQSSLDMTRNSSANSGSFTNDNVILFSSAPNASTLLTPGLDQLKRDKESLYAEVEFPKLLETNFTDKTSPITEILEKKIDTESANKEQPKDTQKKEVQNNELADGVDIAAMAVQPKGYETYNTLTLIDSPFYISKEIYRNQKPIDNAKASRSFQLRNDMVHQQMIEQQYLK